MLQAAPNKDHTKGTGAGSFVFVEGSRGDFLSSAVLSSPDLPAVGSSCLMTFWYNINGKTSGSLILEAQVK